MPYDRSMTDPFEPVQDTDERAITTEPEGPLEIPWRLVAALVIVALIVVFAVQNTQDVELRFLAWSWQLPLVIVILVAVVVSILLDQILSGIVRRRRRRHRHELEELRRLRGDE